MLKCEMKEKKKRAGLYFFCIKKQNNNKTLKTELVTFK